MSKHPFITFEGPDGAGKTTILKAISPWLKQLDPEILITHEPGGQPIAEQIRNIILDPNNQAMTGRTELLLYEAARAQLVETTLKPHLKTGAIVCDRYIDSTFAYQGGGNHFAFHQIERLNQFAINGLKPDLTIYFKIPAEVGLARIQQNRPEKQDRLDEKSLKYHQAVNNAYDYLASMHPERIQIIDATQSIDDRIAQTKQLIQNLM